jgi:hypothetical protein
MGALYTAGLCGFAVRSSHAWGGSRRSIRPSTMGPQHDVLRLTTHRGPKWVKRGGAGCVSRPSVSTSIAEHPVALPRTAGSGHISGLGFVPEAKVFGRASLMLSVARLPVSVTGIVKDGFATTTASLRRTLHTTYCNASCTVRSPTRTAPALSAAAASPTNPASAVACLHQVASGNPHDVLRISLLAHRSRILVILLLLSGG